MSLNKLLERKRVVNSQIDKISHIIAGSSIFIRHGVELHVAPGNQRLHTRIKEALHTELTDLMEESLSINLKLEAINTLLETK